MEDQLESALSDEKRREITTRLSRALGHLRHVKRMVEDGRDCSEVLIQLAAVNGALSSAGRKSSVVTWRNVCRIFWSMVTRGSLRNSKKH